MRLKSIEIVILFSNNPQNILFELNSKYFRNWVSLNDNLNYHKLIIWQKKKTLISIVSPCDEYENAFIFNGIVTYFLHMCKLYPLFNDNIYATHYKALSRFKQYSHILLRDSASLNIFLRVSRNGGIEKFSRIYIYIYISFLVKRTFRYRIHFECINNGRKNYSRKNYIYF